jgi:membrane fusion protein (multidrug efflux system)
VRADSKYSLAGFFLVTAAAFGCSKGESRTAAGDRPQAGAPLTGPGGRAGGAQTLTLAESDVSIARRAGLVDGIPLTGILRPIETVSVRARLDGDLDAVYVREGDFVRTGRLLARFESSEQESAQQSAAADRASAQSDLATADWRFQQSQELYKAGAIAEGDLRTARSALESARARLAAANSRVRSASSSSRDTRVLAPMSGTIEKRIASAGEHISRGGELFTLVRNDVLELAAAVPERVANQVAIGQRVQFLANGAPFEGRVARLSPTVDPSSRSITVYVQIPNARGLLKGGTFASGTLLARTIANALVIPTSAVRQTASGKQLAYKIVGGVLDTASVQLGVVDDRAAVAEVISGLTDGDSVISGNVGSLGKGMKVQILSPNAGRARGAAGRPAGAGNRQP